MRTRTSVVLGLLLASTLSLSPISATEPERCSRQHVRELVKGFIDSYNRGAFRKLDRTFAKGREFYFYRLFPERPSPFSEQRDELIPYFRERHELNDQFKLIDFELDRKRAGSPRMWGFRFTIERTSNDLAPWGHGTLSGKGAAECRIAMWNGNWSP